MKFSLGVLGVLMTALGEPLMRLAGVLLLVLVVVGELRRWWDV